MTEAPVAVLDRVEPPKAPSKPPPSEPVEPPKRPESEIAKLRRKLGLPEKSPLLDIKTQQQEKQRLLQAYIQEKDEQFKSPRETHIGKEEAGFFGRREYIQGERRNVRERVARLRQRPDYKINRFATAKLMQARGLTNADDVVTALEERVDELRLSDLRNFKVIEGLKNIPNLVDAIDRINELGYFVQANHFASESFVDALKTLSEVPEENIKRTISELDKYSFVKKNLCGVGEDGSLLQDFKKVIEIVQNGGLNEEQKEQLEKAYKFAILTGKIPIRGEGQAVEVLDAFFASIDFDTVFNRSLDKVREEAFLFTAEDYIFQKLRTGNPSESIFFTDAFFGNVNDLFQEGKIAFLKEIVGKGWNCVAVEGALNQDGNDYLKSKENVEDYLQRAMQIVNDDDAQQWVAVFQEIQGAKEFDIYSAPIYEQYYAKREALIGLALLSKDMNIPFDGLFSFDDKTGEVNIAINEVQSVLFGINVAEMPESERKFWEYLRNNSAFFKNDNDIVFLSYLIKQKEDFSKLFDEFFSPKAQLVEDVLTGKISLSEEMAKVVNISDSIYVHNVRPELAMMHIDKFSPIQQMQIVVNLPDELLSHMPKLKKDICLFLRANKSWGTPAVGFLLSKGEKFHEYVQDEKLQPTFFYDYFEQPKRFDYFGEPKRFDQAFNLITDETLGGLPPEERAFWLYFRNKGNDVRLHLISKPQRFYIRNGRFDEDAAVKDFIREVGARPENCRTYQSLATLFRDIAANYPKGDEAGMMYVRIVEAHRIRTIDERTGVEDIPALRQAFSGLYRGDMTPFERLSWKILQRQLPFTANEGANEVVRNDMRQKARDVEALNSQKLTWVHQSVHNYASVFEVDYLKALKHYLDTGDQSRLQELRSHFSGQAQAPTYTQEDRQALLVNEKLGPELNNLIELTSLFYEVRPETLRAIALNNMPNLFSQNEELKNLLTSFVERDLPVLREHSEIDDTAAKKSALHFLLNVNKARKTILEQVAREGMPAEIKPYGLAVDAVLDSLSQTVFTKYKDYLSTKNDALTKEEILEGTAILGEVLTASYLNGEMPEGLHQNTDILTAFTRPDTISKEKIHRARLFLPIAKHEIDTHWQAFTALAQPEMADMLMRTGLSKEEADARVYFTDLVDFKKSAMVFVAEPLLSIIEDRLATIEESFPHAVEAEYKRLLGGKILESATDNVEVASFTQQLAARQMPEGLEEEKRFLDALAQQSEAQAEKLARVLVKGYLNRDKLQSQYTKVEKDGKVIEFYPVSFYGVDMVVVLEDGKRVEDPKTFMLQNFQAPQALINSLREGD